MCCAGQCVDVYSGLMAGRVLVLGCKGSGLLAGRTSGTAVAIFQAGCAVGGALLTCIRTAPGSWFKVVYAGWLRLTAPGPGGQTACMSCP